MNWFKRIRDYIRTKLFGSVELDEPEQAHVKTEPEPEHNVLLPIRDQPGSYAFYCPGCETSHVINTDPKRGWPCHSLTGSLARPTIRASVLANPKGIDGAPRCHSFVTSGEIEFLSDCTHTLAGKTVRLVAE